MTESQILEAYLADRNIGCPACGYSLKGCTLGRCPECSLAIELVLRRGDWSSRSRGLLLFAALTCSAYAVLSGGLDLAQTLKYSIMLTGGIPWTKDLSWQIGQATGEIVAGLVLAAIGIGVRRSAPASDTLATWGRRLLWAIVVWHVAGILSIGLWFAVY